VHAPSADVAVVPTLREGFHGERVTGPLLRQPGLLAAVTIFWIVLGAVGWILEYALSFGDPEGPVTLGRAAARWVYVGLWWLASMLGFWLVDTVTVWNWRQYPRMFFHAVAGALIAVGWSVSAYYINLAIIPGWRPEGVGRMVSTTSMTTWFFYTGLICLAHTVTYAREYRAREVKALRAAQLTTEAQLEALKMQLDPHFLFNALNSISTLMHRDVKAANETLVLVSEMLQRNLKTARTQQVTVAEEVETAELFVEIEKVRFQDRLSVVWSVEPEVEDALVPHMLLQPIIDNSLRHGIQAKAGRGRIEVSARRNGERLDIEVRDDGRGLSASGGDSGFGIGLSVTRERLSKLYGRNHSFTLQDAPGGGALVRISIPYVRSEQDSSQEAIHVQTDPGADR
jgi:two-component system LytT family sensor kinase